MSETTTPTLAAVDMGASPPPKGGGQAATAGARIESIQNLRGIASLAVLFDHLIATPYVGAPATLAAIRFLGDYGVTIFFFISGFVLPYSLERAHYHIRDFPKFIARRFVRVDPPFFAIVALTVLLNLLLGVVKKQPYHIDVVQILGHIAYIAPLLHKEWLLSVFWTLCTEFQFYILIGLAFPILRKYPLFVALACALCIWIYVPGYFPTERLPLGRREVIFAYLPCFMMGMATFLYRERLTTLPVFAAATALSMAALFFKAPLDIPVVALITAAIVLYANFYNRLLDFFGRISYSLYLVHLLVILTVLPVVHRLGLPWLVMLAVGAAASIAAAALNYHIVERPALAWSKRLRLKSKAATSPEKDGPQRLELDPISQIGKAP